MTAQGVIRRLRERVKARRGFEEGWRELVTPEGVDLRLKVATYGERFAAFSLDLIFLILGFVAFTLLAFVTGGVTRSDVSGEFLLVVWLLGAFLLRNFYFMAFEVGPRAATPGKRIIGLRVAAADGGRLTADAVFARNAMREVEVFLPLSFLGAQGQGVDAGLIALGAIWSLVFILFPLLNRDRRRLGDLAAGTMVVKAPRKLLEADLAGIGAAAATEVVFSHAQLDVYGVKELHVLEDVLRSASRKSMAEVAHRIKAKVGWEGPADTPDRTFLNAYYAGLRARLESRMLFGHRRRDKFDRA